MPGKNLLPIAGRPLIDWAVDAAVRSGAIERVVVSTDDDNIAAHVSRTWPGVVVFRRAAETATDDASTESAILEYLAADPETDPLVLLQATSPLTTPDDVSAVVSLLEGGFDSALSVVRQRRFRWAVPGSGGAAPVGFDPQSRPRRQDYDGFLVENGAIYACARGGFIASGCRVYGNVGLYEMPADTYTELDEPDDVAVLDQRLRARVAPPPVPSTVAALARRIKLVISDVDGCLTDNGMYYNFHGEELKRFSARDGKGFELLRSKSVRTMLLTSERGEIIERRAAKLRVDHLCMGSTDKVASANLVRGELGLSWNEIAFLGDDVQDVELLRIVGLAACPSDATNVVRVEATYCCRAAGGYGAFRELADVVTDSTYGCGSSLQADLARARAARRGETRPRSGQLHG